MKFLIQFIYVFRRVPRHPRLRRLLRCPKFVARCSLRQTLTATPFRPPCIRHRRRSDSMPKAGALPN